MANYAQGINYNGEGGQSRWKMGQGGHAGLDPEIQLTSLLNGTNQLIFRVKSC